MSDDEAMRREPSGRFSRGELGGQLNDPTIRSSRGLSRKILRSGSALLMPRHSERNSQGRGNHC